MSKYILEQIKIEGVLRDILTVTDGDNVKLSIDGRETTLAAELARLLVEIAALPTETDVTNAVSAAIDALIGGAPGTYDTLKEIADYIAEDKTASAALSAAIGNKVEKVSGMGLSTEDFSTTLKNKLEGLKAVTASSINGNIKIDGAETTVYAHPTGSGNEHIPAGGTEGQILTRTASGYAFADAPAPLRYGATAPADMKDGEMFVRVVG